MYPIILVLTLVLFSASIFPLADTYLDELAPATSLTVAATAGNTAAFLVLSPEQENKIVISKENRGINLNIFFMFTYLNR
jgi:hypothetical protein